MRSVLAALMLTVTTAAHAQSYVVDARVERPIRHLFEVATSGQYAIEAVSTTPGADPVLHVLDTSENEIASNDDYGGRLDPFVNVYLPRGTYVLLVRARRTTLGGRANLLVNKQPRLQDAPFGGLVSDIPAFSSSVETVGTLLGTIDTRIYGLDCSGRVRAFNDNAGVGYHARIGGAGRNLRAEGLCATLVDPLATFLPTRVVYNDLVNAGEDYDGDGLGPRLETTLGSCNAVTESGRCSRAVLHSPSDTDGDGIFDGVEAIGIDHALDPLTLPAWGASPAHKDMFIEVHNMMQPVGPSGPVPDAMLAQETLQGAQRMYAEGAPSDLSNPDGLPGINLHFNLAFPIATRADASLFNASGGVTREPPGTDYRAIRHSRPHRAGVFRLVLAGMGGGGQSEPLNIHTIIGVGDRSGVKLAHELGHSLGLQHWWVRQPVATNCAPQYASNMNYLYAGHPHFSSTNTPFSFNPSLMDERVSLSTDASFLSLMRQVTGYTSDSAGRIDWNRNGYIDDAPVAAPVMLQDAPCEVLGAHRQMLVRLDQSLVAPATPRIVRLGASLVTLSIENGGIMWRRATLGANGSCPNGNDRGQSCGLVFNQGGRLPIVLDRPRAFDAIVHDGSLWIVVHTSGWRLEAYRIAEATFPANTTGPIEVSRFALGAPELARLRAGDHGERTLAVFFTTVAQGTRTSHHFATLANGAFSIKEVLVGAPAVPAPGDLLSPAVVSFGASDASYETCGFFPGVNAPMKYLCYDHRTGGFDQISELTTWPGAITTKPEASLVFEREPRNGRLVTRADRATITLSIAGGVVPYLGLSTPFGAMSNGTERPLRSAVVRRNGHVHNEWFYVVNGTNVSAYDDPTLSTMFGVVLAPGGLNGNEWQANFTLTERALFVLPRYDGLASVALSTGNDFSYMSRTMCLSLRGDSPYCPRP